MTYATIFLQLLTQSVVVWGKLPSLTQDHHMSTFVKNVVFGRLIVTHMY